MTKTPSLDISIIVCSRNRANSLGRTLDWICRCEIPPGLTAEIVIVDNASSDHTRDVVEKRKVDKMAVRYVCEPSPGQCHARNRGLAEGRGEIYIFTDDDVRPEQDWIVRIVEAFSSADIDAMVGRVTFPADRKISWFGPIHYSWLAGTDRCEEGAPELVGANMAFRRQVLERVEGFDVHLGPGGLGFGDDRLFSLRLRAAGYKLAFVSAASVEHHYDVSRVSRGYFMKLAERMGRSEGYLAYHWFHTPYHGFGHAELPRLRSHVRVAIDRFRLMLGALRFDDQITDRELFIQAARGLRDQYRKERRGPRHYSGTGV